MSDHTTFPKLSSAQRIGASGITAVAELVEKELKWRFRRNHQEDDFGIDGFVDIVGEGGAVLGKNFGVQIKTGPSHVAKTSEQGFLFYGERKHLNYLLNSPVPIVLVWVNDSKAWWVHVKPAAVRMTKKGWSILIPKGNLLNKSTRSLLADIAGPVINYLPQVERFHQMRQMVGRADFILFAVTKEEVISKDMSRLRAFFEMFEAAPDTLPSLQHKLVVAVDGWNEDKREIYEIPEARAWFVEAQKAVRGWPYYLDFNTEYSTFLTFFACSCTTKVIGESELFHGKISNFSLKKARQFLNQHFIWLNEFTDKHHFPLRVNKEISKAMGEAMKGWLERDF